MKTLFSAVLLLTALMLPQESSANTCSEVINQLRPQTFTATLASKLRRNCLGHVCSKNQTIRSIYESLQKYKPKNLRAYSAITAIMIGTSSVTAVISAKVGADYPALSHMISMIMGVGTTIGVYVVGAPILEPLQSYLRHSSFKLVGEKDGQEQFLERQFHTTNGKLSSNAQWARSVYRDYIKSLTSALQEVRANTVSDPNHAASLLAEISMRLHDLFPDIDPTHPIVIRSVKAYLSDSVAKPQELLELTLIKVQELGGKPELHKKPIEIWLNSLAE